MNRTVSTILIVLMLVSQSLVSVPHSHAGTSIVEPDGHAARPHFHFYDAHHDHEHHEDGDDTPSSTGKQVPDHDSDSFYAGDAPLLHDGKVANAELTAVYFIPHDSTANAALGRLWRQPGLPPRPKCARYLQLLSIRC
ncbi:MAG: hypothetical protein O2983_13660 [Planctomycetota bacterium]|nr:hypothetical protein [Planctomycetota bacterium]MDA0921684.1 hypothetical protein [Planctomycetota bacterium]MDA1160649.1 hypothetical protein [Planctomycetota bacterium]